MASSPALFASRHSGTRPSRLHSRSESGGTVRMRPAPSSGPGAERTASRRLTIRARRSPPMPAVVMVPTAAPAPPMASIAWITVSVTARANPDVNRRRCHYDRCANSADGRRCTNWRGDNNRRWPADEDTRQGRKR